MRFGCKILVPCLVMLLNSVSLADNPCEADTADPKCIDLRGTFEAKAKVALAVDSFNGSDELTYLNPGDSGTVHLRSAAGFDFGYRLFGNAERKTGDVTTGWGKQNLWVYGQTIHGVRSADTQCSATSTTGQSNSGTSVVSTLPVCQQTLKPPTNPADQLYFIVRNATSLEGYMGFRWEFLPLQESSQNPATAYFKAEAGFLDVAGTKGSALDMHKIAIGAVATKGTFQDSYLEIAYGRSDVFSISRRKRKKVDATIEVALDCGGSVPVIKDTSFYSRITVDTDLGPGSDAVQTYIGFKFNLKNLFSAAANASCSK